MRKLFAVLIVALFVVSGCGGSSESAAPLPTRTPLPTFTPTVPVVATPLDPAMAATAQAEAALPGVVDQPAPVDQPAATDTPVPPTPVPAANVTINSNMNVRGGPGTNYNAIGQATQGSRFDVTGKNGAGDWYQINFNGQTGWVFANLVTAEGVETVAVAANIPAPPPTPVPAPVQPTATPVPQPTAVPVSSKKFNFARLQRCDPQEAGNYIEGTVYIESNPANGYLVVFSYREDGPFATAPQISGPHPGGYEGWNPGYYSHIVKSPGPQEGTYYVWIVDENDNRISVTQSVTFDGLPANTCNQAVIDFDSR